jgi:hypothetical protein
MFVCCECCVLSGRGLCDELITRPEESYRLWCVVLCDLETTWMRRPWPALGRSATKKKSLSIPQVCLLNEFALTSSFADFSFVILFVAPYVLKLPNDNCPDLHYKDYSLYDTGFVTCNCTAYWFFHLNRLLQHSWINTYAVKKAVNKLIYYY